MRYALERITAAGSRGRGDADADVDGDDWDCDSATGCASPYEQGAGGACAPLVRMFPRCWRDPTFPWIQTVHETWGGSSPWLDADGGQVSSHQEAIGE